MRWATRHGRSFPWRQTSDPFKTLVAEMMLQRTRSDQVTPIYERFVGRYGSVAELAKAPSDEVTRILRPLGLASRATTFRKLAQIVVESGLDCPPIRAEDAIKLPGVGPYAASAVDAFLGGRRIPLVDANIARVMSRVFAVGRPDWRYATSAERQSIYEVAALCMGRVRPRSYHYAILDFAAKVCTPLRPGCPKCPMRRARICAYGSAEAKTE
jgi:A/G-specific adenine glycosylase